MANLSTTASAPYSERGTELWVSSMSAYRDIRDADASNNSQRQSYYPRSEDKNPLCLLSGSRVNYQQATSSETAVESLNTMPERSSAASRPHLMNSSGMPLSSVADRATTAVLVSSRPTSTVTALSTTSATSHIPAVTSERAVNNLLLHDSLHNQPYRQPATSSSQRGVLNTPDRQHIMSCLQTNASSSRATGSTYNSSSSGSQLLLQCKSKRQLALEQNRTHTACLMAAISVAQISLLLTSMYFNDWVFEDLVNNPLLGPGAEALSKIGGTYGPSLSSGHQYWRLAVSPFVGAGVLHVAANISVLFTYGMLLSNVFYTWQLALILVAGSLSSVIISANFGTTFITAAGSAPAFGALGAATAFLLLHRRHLRNHLISWVLLALSLLVNAFIGAMPFVDNSGNTVSFAVSLLAAAGLVALDQQPTPCNKGSERFMTSAAMALLSVPVLIPALGIIGLNSGLPLADYCNQWVCTPTPWWNCSAAQILPSVCDAMAYANGTMSLYCPNSGGHYSFQSDILLSNSSSIASLCAWYCSLVTTYSFGVTNSSLSQNPLTSTM
ncbi:hypothetical protein CEUSTIGMA_g6060.t1 [Chlamydomonas eustigma]|uniref:RHOMBOID-like protein n=1 Tax=Chlamydomonas eustigma TaxID=1157962 RepID=A0A250X6B8_9CHLO|nr:hypothetical protein CEUSTIGMA_g6060.t1 [Chlamydomonas eustigma]|eukprot:GAX78621.1 hypothetical protein CEUSTIGMA_g6060.t1 [Chlamydomonas eustigma]